MQYAITNHDYILLDRSGSMGSQWTEAINSVNSYVATLAANPVTKDTKVTLAVFDGDNGKLDFKIIRNGFAANEWDKVRPIEVDPRGMTPLYDATATLIRRALEDNPTLAAIIIMTDGGENSSREYSKAAVNGLLDTVRKKEWQVLFLGANFDNSGDAIALGAQFKDYVRSTASNLSGTMQATAESRATYTTSGASMGYTNEDKKRFETDRK